MTFLGNLVPPPVNCTMRVCRAARRAVSNRRNWRPRVRMILAERFDMLRNSLENLARRLGMLAWLFIMAEPALADKTLNIVFTCHSSTTNSFWQAVKLGFDDACGKIGAKGQFIFVQTEGSIEQQVANMQAGGARKPAALIKSLVDKNAFICVVKDAKEKRVN